MYNPSLWERIVARLKGTKAGAASEPLTPAERESERRRMQLEQERARGAAAVHQTNLHRGDSGGSYGGF